MEKAGGDVTAAPPAHLHQPPKVLYYQQILKIC